MTRCFCTASFFVRACRQGLVLLLAWLAALGAAHAQAPPPERLDLAGEWRFAIDSLDQGAAQRWFAQDLADKISLPGSMTTNGKGSNISLRTPWTGQIVDSSWFFKPEYAPYRQPGNIKVPFWLQPVKYYKGAAWYQKTIDIPAAWAGRPIELYLERAHWETTVWLDDQPLGTQNSLGTAHVVTLGRAATPGRHRLTVRVDNRVKDFNVGQNSHSISDHTQSNWNGLVGQLYLAARPLVYVADAQVFPDIQHKQVLVRLRLRNTTGQPLAATLGLQASLLAAGAQGLPALTQKVRLGPDTTALEVTYPMGAQPQLWSEFTPNIYQLTVGLSVGKGPADTRQVRFGMREFGAKGTQFTINGQLTFLRGTLECAIFPKTGYPPTDVAAWQRIFSICKAYGLNHVRFHSWCPPEAAFTAADQAGMYLQIECSSWANQGAVVGDGRPLDAWLYAESRRMVRDYGNHPSFCMLTYGNEPAGKNHVACLTKFVSYWKATDARRLYTSASGWPVIAESNYNVTPDPRIQAWGQGLKSIINAQPPRADYDWRTTISKWQHPTVSHEIGQWCVYPDFKEITKYDGVLKPKNFEIFRDKLAANHLATLADSFLLASGKLQVLCYKADIEAALRTPGFGGFQLLDLHDFPGQGTALVGVLSPFWEDKGYVTGPEYRRFCNATVPLARFPKMVYLNSETLTVPVEIAHFGPAPLPHVMPTWTIEDAQGQRLFSGTLLARDIALGNGQALGEIRQVLGSLTQPRQLRLRVAVGSFENTWDFFVYPSTLPAASQQILVTQRLDRQALDKLRKGGSVLLTAPKGSIRPEAGANIALGFSSIFWNTAWTGGQAPTTLGILCNPRHPALRAFPTAYHSNWQWWDAVTHASPIRLDAVAPGLQPIVRVIDDWVTAQSLGLVFECQVGKGKLLFSAIDLVGDAATRPEARQLRTSLEQYMASPSFRPATPVAPERIASLLK
jgi:hypothetical protein